MRKPEKTKFQINSLTPVAKGTELDISIFFSDHTINYKDVDGGLEFLSNYNELAIINNRIVNHIKALRCPFIAYYNSPILDKKENHVIVKGFEVNYIIVFEKSNPNHFKSAQELVDILMDLLIRI